MFSSFRSLLPTGHLKRSFECSKRHLLTLLQKFLCVPSALRTVSLALANLNLMLSLLPDTVPPPHPTLQPHSAPSLSVPLPRTAPSNTFTHLTAGHLSGCSLDTRTSGKPSRITPPPHQTRVQCLLWAPSCLCRPITALITIYFIHLVTRANSSITQEAQGPQYF